MEKSEIKEEVTLKKITEKLTDQYSCVIETPKGIEVFACLSSLSYLVSVSPKEGAEPELYEVKGRFVDVMDSYIFNSVPAQVEAWDKIAQDLASKFEVPLEETSETDMLFCHFMPVPMVVPVAEIGKSVEKLTNFMLNYVLTTRLNNFPEAGVRMGRLATVLREMSSFGHLEAEFKLDGRRPELKCELQMEIQDVEDALLRVPFRVILQDGLPLAEISCVGLLNSLKDQKYLKDQFSMVAAQRFLYEYFGKRSLIVNPVKDTCSSLLSVQDFHHAFQRFEGDIVEVLSRLLRMNTFASNNTVRLKEAFEIDKTTWNEP